MNGKIGYKRIVNQLAVIAFVYAYVHYVAPVINAYVHNFFLSWGVALMLIGIWGNLVKLTLLKSIFITDNYKLENYVWMAAGGMLILAGTLNAIVY